MSGRMGDFPDRLSFLHVSKSPIHCKPYASRADTFSIQEIRPMMPFPFFGFRSGITKWSLFTCSNFSVVDHGQTALINPYAFI